MTPVQAMHAAKAARRAAVLAVPAVCCVGHDCDGCRTCRLGRCCKRDLPNYHMPELGSWEGPVWGTLGVLVDDGEHVQCHACGDWLRALGYSHLWHVHGIWAAEYRAYFGLNTTQGLTGGATHALLTAHTLRLVAEGKLQSGADALASARANFTAEQRSEVGSRPHRLQQQLAEPQRRAKISDAHTGRPRSPEHIANMRKAHLGRPKSPEQIVKMREANLGKKASPETRQKQSAARLGRPKSPETREKMRDSWTPERKAAQAEKTRAMHAARKETKAKTRAGWTPMMRAAHAERRRLRHGGDGT